MGLVFFMIPVGILSFGAYKIWGYEIASWFLYVSVGLIAIFFLKKSFSMYFHTKAGGEVSAVDIIGIAACPFSSTIILIAILVLITGLFKISAFHLLWFYPVEAALFEFTIGKRAINKINTP